MQPNPIGEAIAAAAKMQFENRKRSFVDVPEWPVEGANGVRGPARIFYDPMPLEEHLELINYRAKDGPQYAPARIVALKSTDEAGNRLFTAEHEILFCKGVSASAVLRVYNAITGWAATLEELTKN